MAGRSWIDSGQEWDGGQELDDWQERKRSPVVRNPHEFPQEGDKVECKHGQTWAQDAATSKNLRGHKALQHYEAPKTFLLPDRNVLLFIAVTYSTCQPHSGISIPNLLMQSCTDGYNA